MGQHSFDNIISFRFFSSCLQNNTAPNPSQSTPATPPAAPPQASGNTCKGSIINKTALFVSVGVVVSLFLVYVIVATIRCVYKPLRPRIKKTYVVHKNVSPTPLTCRPTTEQCEITIENCCNMNICDTVSKIQIPSIECIVESSYLTGSHVYIIWYF